MNVFAKSNDTKGQKKEREKTKINIIEDLIT